MFYRLFNSSVVCSLLLASSLLLSVNSANAAQYTLKLAHPWSSNNMPLLGTSTVDFANIAKKMSNGRIEIRVDPNGKHKAGIDGLLDLVKIGQYDIGQSSSYFYSGKDPLFLYFSTIPFGMNYLEQYSWFQYGGGLQLANEVYNKHGLVFQTAGNTGVQMGGWFKKEIKSLADLKGLKMRIPGFGGKVFNDVGGSATTMTGSELYKALESNTIDAAEFLGPAIDIKLGLHKVAPYYYTGWHEPGTELMYVFNKKKLESLPQDIQYILLESARLAGFNMTVASLDQNAKAWAKMKTELPNIKIKTFPQEVMTALRQANDKILAENAKKDPMAKKILDSRAAYAKTVRTWTDFSERAYLNSRD